jgi:hypothetical protein
MNAVSQAYACGAPGGYGSQAWRAPGKAYCARWLTDHEELHATPPQSPRSVPWTGATHDSACRKALSLGTIRGVGQPNR